jgi:hypothetical protein
MRGNRHCKAGRALPATPKVQGIGIATWVTARWAHWQVHAERGSRLGIEQGLLRLFQRSTRVQRQSLVVFVLDDRPEYLPPGMGKVVCPPMVGHRPIRDGPIRRRPQPDGLLQDVSHEAA